jgi:glycosyltransferase involved in cell wall biosynthesis
VRVLIDYRPALRERSGVGEYTHQLTKALLACTAGAKTGRTLELTLFSSSWKDRLRAATDLAGATIVDRKVPVRVLNFAWHRLGWPPAELLARSTFDVVHSPHPLLTPARRAAQVVMIHDLNFLTHPERTRAEIRRDYPALARDHARRADAVLVPSAYTANEVERLFDVPRDRLAVCAPGAPDWSPRATTPTDGYILFFGTLEPRKNVGGLLDAYERLLAASQSSIAGGGQPVAGRRSIPTLVLAGRATAEAQPWLDRINRPPLRGAVRHVGYVDANHRRPLFEGAQLLVQPSFDEGFGMTVLEAMSVGVPVVAANRGSLPEVLAGAGVLCDPDQPADMARAIGRLLDDQQLSAACSSRGLVRATAFSWRGTADRVFETYLAAIDRRRARTAGRI